MFLILILSVFVELLPLQAEEVSRIPNELEEAYLGMVLEGFTAELCKKISPCALRKAGGSSPGTQVYYLRSQCFLYAAGKELNPYYCQWVKEAKSLFLSGSYFSADNCRQIVAKGMPFNFQIGFSYQAVLKHLGYPHDDGEKQLIERDGWQMFFYQKRAELQRRLGELHDFSQDCNVSR